MYFITVETSGKNVSKGKHVIHVKAPFTNWFDEQGFFVPKPLQNFLESSIPDIAASKAVREMKKEKSEKK